MDASPRRWSRSVWTGVIGVALVSATSGAERRVPPEREWVAGAELVTVLDWGDIPAIDEPRFVSTDEADRFMAPDEPVVGVTGAGGAEPRCYSLQLLDHHEVVNDVVAGVPLAVTW